ncbi:uncharacterized protein Dyak_GE28626 [Drosophila yakuba]|uniref:RING-type domain-containing protein n=1 Tax=Drosophila yakuba TaxID=7245 RepID=A0A0R1ECI7_DROYA|nr:uncharacterized protein Dyak_GE28626 [Drosophila yakuba]
MPLSEEEGSAGSSPKCILCEKSLASASVVKIKCGHKFHKNCFEVYSKTSNTCPICKEPQHHTRLQKRQNTPSRSAPANNEDSGQAEIPQQLIGNMVAEQVKAMQNELLTQNGSLQKCNSNVGMNGIVFGAAMAIKSTFLATSLSPTPCAFCNASGHSTYYCQKFKTYTNRFQEEKRLTLHKLPLDW